MKRFLILGANSGIAAAFARLAAQKGDALFLVSRNEARLEALVQDLKVRGAKQIASLACDLDDFSKHRFVLDEANRFLGGTDSSGGTDHVLIAHGVLPDQLNATEQFDVVQKTFRTNFESPASLLHLLAKDFEEKKKGTIAVITSVAADRGRQSNYVYGSSKAALDSFVSGLRNRMSAFCVRVITVRPGFVDTPMTALIPKGPLFTSPEKVARGIYRAIQFGCPVVYVPGFWRLIMFIIRSIPERVFMRMKL